MGRLIFAVLLPLTLAAGEKTEILSGWDGIRVGDLAPPFGSFDAAHDDRTVGLTRVLDEREVRGVVLSVFSTSCLPCRKGITLLKEAETRLARQGLRILLISLNEDPELVKRFVAAEKIALVTLTDKFGAILKPYGIDPDKATSLPKTYLIAKDRKIVKILGKEGDDFIAVIEEAFK